MDEKKRSLLESIVLESDACVSLVVNIIFYLRVAKNSTSKNAVLDTKIEDFIKNAAKLENFLGSIIMRKEYRTQHEDLVTMILDGQNHNLLHNSMNYKHINTLVMQYFDSFTAGDVLHHLLSLLSDRSLRGDEEKQRQCLLNRLEVLKRNLRSFLLQELLRSSLSSSPPSSLSSSIQLPVPIIRQLSIDELSHRSLRWLASLSPLSDSSTDSTQQQQGHRIAVPLGLCFRCNWDAALVCARKFHLSHSHQAISLSSSAHGGGNQDIPFHASRLLLWMGLLAAVSTRLSTTSDANATSLKYLHFPIGVSFGMDESLPRSADQGYNVAYVVSQLAPERSLQEAYFSSAEARISLKPTEKVSILLDVAMGLRALHYAGLVHGRVKARNVLLFPGSPRYRAKIADFGLQAALTPRERSSCSGEDSGRWTAPEVLAYEAQLEEDTAKRVANQSNTVKMKSYDVAAPLCLSVDSYSFGLLIMALLTEKVPFHNLLWEEGVRTQLVTGGVRPTLSSTYPNKDTLAPLENLIADCTNEEPLSRPSMDEVAKRLETFYVGMCLSEVKADLIQRQDQFDQLQKEDADYEEKITKQLDLISRANIILARKESEKAVIYKVKERAAKEAELEKGRSRLKQFEDDLEGFRRDKAGLEEDMTTLNTLLDELKGNVNRGAADLMASRSWNEQVDQEDLRRKYTLEKERTSPYIQSLSGRALNQLISSSFSTSVISSEKKKIESEWDELIRQLWDASMASGVDASRNSGSNSRQQQVRYKTYVDNIATLMLHPEDANLSGVASHPTTTPTITAVSNSIGAAGMPPKGSIGNSSNLSMVSSLTGYSESRPAEKILQHDSDDDSDDDHSIVDNNAEGNTRRRGSRSSSGDNHLSHPPLVNSDDENDDNDGDGDGSRIGDKMATANGDTVREVVFEFDSKVASLVATEEEEGIPEEDLIRVLYLAASTGDLEEALGVYRNSMGFSHAEVEAMVNRQHSPIHLAAYLGNLEALREIYQQYSFEVCALFDCESDSRKLLYVKDDSGDTPLHCACRRGHFNVVKALVEEFNSDFNDANHNGLLPIHLALSAGSLRIVKYFMEDSFFGMKRIKADLLDGRYGASLLHWASLNDGPQLIDYLLTRYKFNVDIVAQSDNSTCLQWACFGSTLEVVKHLIERCNANVLATTSIGMSCLHMAVLSGVVEKAEYLIDKVGLKVNAKDGMGRSSFDIAQGRCLLYLLDRNEKGFLTGSLVDKAKKSKN